MDVANDQGVNQFEFQYPKMEVRQCTIFQVKFWGYIPLHSPYLGLIYIYIYYIYINMVGTSNESVAAMAIGEIRHFNPFQPEMRQELKRTLRSSELCPHCNMAGRF